MCTFENKKDIVWRKAKKMNETDDGSEARLDPCGAVIKYAEFNNCNSDFGWVVDYIVSPEKLRELGKMPEEIEAKVMDDRNLRAMHWRNKKSKNGDYPTYRFVVSSEDGEKNISLEGDIKVCRSQRQDVESLFGI